MRMMCRPKWSLLLMYVSRNTRRIDFPLVDGLSTDTPILGRHNNNESMPMLKFSNETYEICYNVQGIYTNCIRYMNQMYKGVQAYHFSRVSIDFFTVVDFT